MTHYPFLREEEIMGISTKDGKLITSNGHKIDLSKTWVRKKYLIKPSEKLLEFQKEHGGEIRYLTIQQTYSRPYLIDNDGKVFGPR